MNDTIYQLRKFARKGLAATLFTLLLFGASTAALSAFAAGVNALSGMHSSPVSVAPAQVTQPAANPTPAQTLTGRDGKSVAPQVTSPTGALPNPTQDIGVTTASYVDSLNEKLDHMESPIGHSLDTGGVVLGEKVQQTFGQVMSGLMQTLFLEQDGSNQHATGGQP